MTGDPLQPFVRDLLEEAMSERDLDMAILEELLTHAKTQEGARLREAVETILRRA